MPELGPVYESILYADDLEAIERFYADVLGLPVISKSDLFVSFRCRSSVLLVFNPHKSMQKDRTVPGHGATGPGHLAFAAEEEELACWREHLISRGVTIESEVKWGNGGTSIYFRDPAGNSLELAPPDLW